MSSHDARRSRTSSETMQRVTIRVPTQQVQAMEQLVDQGEYPNRSEAIRAAIREHVREMKDYDGAMPWEAHDE